MRAFLPPGRFFALIVVLALAPTACDVEQGSSLPGELILGDGRPLKEWMKTDRVQAVVFVHPETCLSCDPRMRSLQLGIQRNALKGRTPVQVVLQSVPTDFQRRQLALSGWRNLAVLRSQMRFDDTASAHVYWVDSGGQPRVMVMADSGTRHVLRVLLSEANDSSAPDNP